MELTYNGYRFNEHSHIDIDTDIIYDEAGRIPMEKRLIVVVKSLITPDPSESQDGSLVCPVSNDATLESIREKLCDSAKVFELRDSGFGDVIVNATNPDSLLDLKSGPKPQALKWHPIAGHAAAEIVWTCEITIPCCENDTGLKSISYSVGFQINQKGFTTRSVKGSILVSQSVASGSPNRSADDFRDRIVVDKPTNFQRAQDYSLSADRSRLEFAITDTENESPNAFPAGVVSISAPLRMRIPYPTSGDVVAKNSVSVRLELEATTPRTRAWEIFVAIFRARIAGYLAGDGAAPVIVTEIDISEDWFSHQYSFSVSYTVTRSFNSLLVNSGLFQAFPVNWGDWSASVANAHRSRGQGQLRYSAGVQSDSLIGLCDNPEGNARVRLEAVEYFRSPGMFSILCNEEAPPPPLSWIKYDSHIVEATSYNRTHIQTYGSETKATADFAPIDPNDGGAATTVTPGTGEDAPTQLLADGVAGQYWIWKGHAQRVGHPIPKIGKTRIGETEVEVIGEPRILRRLVGHLFCQPVYEVAWSIALVATSTPTPMPNEADPTLINSDYGADVGTGQGEEITMIVFSDDATDAT